ncbi:hypothetical protein R1flu_023785 [Riccia fluitans]|uniref:Plastid lipid-associated protein/fibrillin conserved domain-containing protein n=1 Tax=Riccia fluitans TaxID=41844 RepID=A0ABD1XTV4_9MARC
MVRYVGGWRLRRMAIAGGELEAWASPALALGRGSVVCFISITEKEEWKLTGDKVIIKRIKLSFKLFRLDSGSGGIEGGDGHINFIQLGLDGA